MSEETFLPEPSVNDRVQDEMDFKEEEESVENNLQHSNNNDSNNVETEESSTIRFYPPAYIQRYIRVREALEKRLLASDDTPKSILEVGCAEISMHSHLKNLSKVEKLIYLDIDEDLLLRMKLKVTPLTFECLIKRETPLVVEVYSGCITKADERVLKCDPPLFAIVGIEILEHLDTDVEIGFIKTLFDKYAPPLIILTTPNSDFNTVLSIEAGKFRHWDHRFELTRQEFVNWCSLVCDHFPNYKFSIEGIAEGPEGSEMYGCLSQMVIFERKCPEELISQPQELTCRGPLILNPVYRVDRNQEQQLCGVDSLNLNENKLMSEEISNHNNNSSSSSEPYKLLERVEYPWCVKPPIREQVRDEVRYYISHYTLAFPTLEEFWENGITTTSVPTQSVLERCQSMLKCKANEIDEDILRNWLNEDGYQLEGEPGDEKIIVPIPPYDEYTKGWYSSEEEEYENDETMNLQQNCDHPQVEEVAEDWDC